MDRETSYGIIPFRVFQGEKQVLLVQHHAGHWSFPKGRLEMGEEPKQCAVRELKEETGVDLVRYLSDESFTEQYRLMRNGRPAKKIVTYFVAEVEGEPEHQVAELSACRWVGIEEALGLITFPKAKTLFKTVLERKLPDLL